MRKRLGILAAIVAGGVVLGLAVGGLPNHRNDTRLRLVTNSTEPARPNPSTGAP